MSKNKSRTLLSVMYGIEFAASTDVTKSKPKPIPGPHLVYGFLTTSPNAIVESILSKAMPVILTT